MNTSQNVVLLANIDINELDPTFGPYIKDKLNINVTFVTMRDCDNPSDSLRSVIGQLPEGSNYTLTTYTTNYAPRTQKQLYLLQRYASMKNIEFKVHNYDITEPKPENEIPAYKTNSKPEFHRVCQQLGIPTIPNKIIIDFEYDEAGNISNLHAIRSTIKHQLQEFQSNVYVQHPLSGGGFGTIIFELEDLVSRDTFEAKINEIIELTQPDPNLRIQPSEFISAPHIEYTDSPAISFNVNDDGSISDCIITGQIQNPKDNSCIGITSFHDVSERDQELMKEYAQRLGEYLFRQGYRGPSNIDFIRVPEGDGYTLYAVESNTRYTAGNTQKAIQKAVQVIYNKTLGAITVDHVPVTGMTTQDVIDLLSHNGIPIFDINNEASCAGVMAQTCPGGKDMSLIFFGMSGEETQGYFTQTERILSAENRKLTRVIGTAISALASKLRLR